MWADTGTVADEVVVRIRMVLPRAGSERTRSAIDRRDFRNDHCQSEARMRRAVITRSHSRLARRHARPRRHVRRRSVCAAMAGHTAPMFQVTHLGVLRQQPGSFTEHRPAGRSCSIPRAPGGGSIDVAIDLSSVDTGWDLRDDFIRGEDMFDVARYPRCSSSRRDLEYRGRQIVAAEGEVTLHGRDEADAARSAPTSSAGRNPSTARELRRDGLRPLLRRGFRDGVRLSARRRRHRRSISRSRRPGSRDEGESEAQ